MFLDGMALLVAIKSRSELGTRQLLRQFETEHPSGYGKALLLKTLPLVSPKDRDWLKSI
jgi:hypothetical protein